ncbi:MAG TPA: hypothetical protein H9785_10655 [Candidatus Bacteroides intestinavium]|uniref:Lipoprotein n=1 Tax=Candidatus Bacteroides intestinavium TaxID=2838469 RepID=A0A9D2HV89_9BACE|nr:hypothetical protein [Candidatus Bacteroides intestinavium]
MRTNLFIPLFILAALSFLSSCISPQDEASDCNDCNQQQIILQVQENSAATTRAGRPLYSNEPNQLVDHVALFICYYGNTDKPDNRIVAVQHITDWEKESTEYDNGRSYHLNLMGSNRVPEGEANYKIYAIGYTDREKYKTEYTYDGKSLHEYLESLTADSDFPENLTLSLSSTPGEEIFAGINTETNGLIHSNEAGGFTTRVVLHRQVAGVYMYVKDIPQRDQATELRLTAACDNDGLVLEEFDTEDYGQNRGKGKYVVNGTTPQEEITASNRAILCTIDLNAWKEENGTWKNPYDATNQNPAFQSGSYFAGSFVIPFAAPTETSATSLQLELYGGESQKPLKTWNVKLPQDDAQVQTNFTRWTWQDNGFTSVQKPETQEAYSLLRNHLYCIGRKDKDGDTTDDQPISLGDSNEIILKVIAEWDIIYDMQLEPKPTKQGQ